MKKSAIRKEFYMSIKKTFSRFLSLVIIVALGVAFYAGIRSTEPDMNYTADAMYDNTNFFDIRVLSANGMTEDDIDKLEKIDCIQDVEGIYYMDAFAAGKENRYTVRLNSLSDKVSTINLREGKMPQKENECLVDTQLFENNDLQIGDTIEIETGTQIGAKMYLTETSYEIVGSYTTPYYLQIDKGTTTLGSGKINGCIAICKDNFTQPVYTEIYATVDGAKELVAYTEEYTDKVDDAVLKVEKQFDKDIYYVLDRTSVPSYVEFDMDAERIGKLGDVVPIIFFLVAALVSLNTMTRMVEEERTQIGTLKALGYGRASVSKKYIVYALLATIIGSVIGGIAGCQVIPRTIINAYMIMYQNLTV